MSFMHVRVVSVVLFALLAALSGVGLAAAQDDPATPIVITEPGHIVVQAALCTDASCDDFAELLDGFTISAVDPVSGEVFSSCVTDNAQQELDHQCILDVPSAGDVEFVWSDEDVPAR